MQFSNNYEFDGNPWKGMSLEEIYEALSEGREGLPRWPDTKLQAGYAGTHSVALLRRAFAFLNILDEDGAFCDGWRGLDYGCGWGRFASVMLSKGTPEQFDLVDA